MNQKSCRTALITALASLSLATVSLQAQTYVSISNLLFSEDFSSYAPGTPPTTTANGGLWGTATHNAAEGFFGVVQDVGDVFGQGTANQFLRLQSTRNLNPGLITPTFYAQEVLTYGFDFIGRVVSGTDSNRWLNVDPRAGTLAAHITSPRMFNGTIRADNAAATATTVANVTPTLNPTYGSAAGTNNIPIRIVTIMNNRADTISYDKPDGSGTADLSGERASLWLYHYNTATWNNLLPEYIYSRSSSITTGAVMDNLRFFMDSNAFLRSFDVDNITVYGSMIPEPSSATLLALLGLPLAARMFRRGRQA